MRVSYLIQGYLQIIFMVLLCGISYANDFIAFEENENEGFLRLQETSQVQTNVVLTQARTKEKTLQQLSLLRQANIKRNGFYMMVAGNVIPIQRLVNAAPQYIFSTGMGVRGGVISYLDSYIGMRGYFAFDFTHDNFAFIQAQHNPYNGTLLMASLGLDILIDFFIGKNYKHTVGFFMGVGAGAFIYFDTKTPITIANSQTTSTYNFGANVMIQGGLSMVIAYRHRFEIGCKFLPSQSLDVWKDGVVADYNPYIAYSYKF